MKNSCVKLLARNINEACGKKLYFANIFFILLRFLCLGLSVFFLFMLSALDKFILNLPQAAYYAVFSLGAFFTLWYFIICGHLQKRTFYFSGRQNHRVKVFHIIKISAQLKIIYLHILRSIINFGTFILYLLPCLATLAVSLYFLQSGMPKMIFYACVALFSMLLLTGVLFLPRAAGIVFIDIPCLPTSAFADHRGAAVAAVGHGQRVFCSSRIGMLSSARRLMSSSASRPSVVR